MDLENTFGSSNYLPGTEVLVRIVDVLLYLSLDE